MDFEDEAIEAIGVRVGTSADSVEDALSATVAGTLAVGGAAKVFERHMRRTRQWVREGREGTPPFLGVLATFCLAAERMARGDGMSAHNYFGRLHEVLRWDADDSRLDQAYRRVSERLVGRAQPLAAPQRRHAWHAHCIRAEPQVRRPLGVPSACSPHGS